MSVYDFFELNVYMPGYSIDEKDEMEHLICAAETLWSVRSEPIPNGFQIQVRTYFSMTNMQFEQKIEKILIGNNRANWQMMFE